MDRAAPTPRRSRRSSPLAQRRSKQRAWRGRSRRTPSGAACANWAREQGPSTFSAWQTVGGPGRLCHNRHDGAGAVKFLRMKPGHGEVLLAEGDVAVAGDEERLVEAFREQLEQGMWAAVPRTTNDGRREAQMVKAFDEVPRDAERVIFFPRAAGGR